jgi:hypothetical protein
VGLDTLLFSALAIDQPVEATMIEWDVERLYRAIDDRRPAPSRSTRETQAAQRAGAQRGGGGAGGHETQASVHRAPPSIRQDDGPRAARARAIGAKRAVDLLPDAGTQGLPEAEAEQAREWSERVLRAHTGDGEFSMLRALIADLPRTRTPWE